MTNLERYKDDLAKLLKLGKLMSLDFELRTLVSTGKISKERREATRGLEGTFEKEYQRWYSESLAVVRQLLPARLTEFESLYKSDGRRKQIGSETYTIQDWLLGLRATPDRFTGAKAFDDFAVVMMRFSTQVSILQTVESRLESSLFDIRQLVQADLYDSEIDGARELLKTGFLRAAGIVAGVVLEKHLQEVCNSHAVSVHKKNPTIGDLNDALKDAGVLDIPMWRQIQRLADVRNLCGHQKQREPTKDEVAELIEGSAKTAKTMH